jgi:hypothetical protein
VPDKPPSSFREWPNTQSKYNPQLNLNKHGYNKVSMFVCCCDSVAEEADREGGGRTFGYQDVLTSNHSLKWHAGFLHLIHSKVSLQTQFYWAVLGLRKVHLPSLSHLFEGSWSRTKCSCSTWICAFGKHAKVILSNLSIFSQPWHTYQAHNPLLSLYGCIQEGIEWEAGSLGFEKV